MIYQGVTDLCDEPTRDGLPVISEVRIERDADLIYVQADGALALTETGGVVVGAQPVTAWGWGSDGGVKRSCKARPVRLTTLPAAECFSALQQEGLTERYFCTRPVEESGPNTCSGDSGGPVIVEDLDGLRVVGITPSGRGCDGTSIGFNAYLLGF